ncbi:MAG: two-component sensor histidine kinase, partial [Tannerella sp.]|nr:two-component sensor histidine kinase [Tannerella sp.]
MIWILTGLIAFAFIGLLILQVQYVVTITKTSNELFDLTVHRSLENVSRDLVREESSKYIQEYTRITGYSGGSSFSDINQYNLQNANDIILNKNNGYSTPKTNSVSELEQMELKTRQQAAPQKLGSAPVNKTSIIDRLEVIQRSNLDRYYAAKEFLDVVAYEVMMNAHLRPLDRRVNFMDLQLKIMNDFANNGLNLPFVLMVVNNNEQLVFQSEPLAKNPRSSDIITQVIFHNDPPSRYNYIKIYFPTKNDYISESVSFLVPSIIFSLILLFTFSITIYIIFRQKRLSEMKNDFINNMTHELKTPVSTISIAAQ